MGSGDFICRAGAESRHRARRIPMSGSPISMSRLLTGVLRLGQASH